MEEEFTQHFPEWVLCESLRKSKDKFSLWNSEVVRLINAPRQPKSFAQIFSGIKNPCVKAERPFKKEECTYFGFGDKRDLYEKYYWSLRPDFLIEDSGNQLLLLLEAKGGEINPTAWKKPKEVSYYNFLKQCGEKFPIRGLFYIVPKKFFDNFRECLLKKEFQSDDSIRTGVIRWEDVVPEMYEELLGTAVDEILRNTEGLKALRKLKGR
jgi:hypothetical protein